LEEANVWELLPYRKEFAELVSFFCCDGSPTQILCVDTYFFLFGDDSERLNKVCARQCSITLDFYDKGLKSINITIRSKIYIYTCQFSLR